MKKIRFGLIFILLLIAGKAGAQCNIALSSAVGTDDQTVCIGTAIEIITYTTDANGASFNNLPNGVSGSLSGTVITISGTPTQAGTYNYSVRLSGCGSIQHPEL
jgi:hypothetical protein